jgi:hypothetical protein
MKTFLLLLGLAAVLAAESFDERFDGTTLRVDLVHHGSATEEGYALLEMRREGVWAGSQVHLLDPTNLGCHQARLYDLATNALLYSRGFCTLFGEWQATNEAKAVSRGFVEPLLVPMPRAAAQLVIAKRDERNIFHELYSQFIDPADPNIRPDRRLEGVPVRVLRDAGDPATALDIAVIAEGYTAGDAEKAVADGMRFTAMLLAARPFDRYADRISVRLVLPASPVTGPDEPLKGRHGASPAGCSFNTFGSARYLTSEDGRALRDLAGLVPYDALLVMVNFSRYGGGGIFNQFSIFVSDNEYDDYVFIHEFGHAFAGLADEYFTAGMAEEFYKPGVEPWEPNLTQDLRNLKWKGFATAGVPIPTPAEAKYAGAVGAFEGGGYKEKGIWRSSQDCRMFSKSYQDFCPVCMAAVESVLKLYTE